MVGAMMFKKVSLLVVVSGFLGGCGVQLSPSQLVGEQSSDVAVKEFLYAGGVLAQRYGLELQMAYVAPPPTRPNLQVLGVSVKSAIPYHFDLAYSPEFLSDKDRYEVRDYFIRAGHHASQIVCRNYLSGLRDRNEYFEFMQQELKVATNLTGMLLTLTNVAEQSKDIFTQVVGAGNLGADAYQNFKFLAPEIETILPLVEAAQVAMRDYFVGPGRPATFAGALNAVSKIEYQCSRSGIRAILTKTLVQSKPQYSVVDGVLYAHEAEKAAPKAPKETTAAAKGGTQTGK
jgi:hypothetical protein